MLSGQFPALETLVRPHVTPVSVPTTIGDTEIIEIAVDGLKGIRALQVEDDVSVRKQHRLTRENLIFLSEEAAPAEIPDDRLNPVFRCACEGLVFAGEVDFRLNASCARRRVVRGEHVWEAQTRITNVLVVEIGHVRAGNIFAVHTDIHEN